MEHAKSWTTLHQLVGYKMPLVDIVATIRKFDRREGLFILAQIAADLANRRGGVTGPYARAWTHDLLVQRIGSSNPLEDAVSRAVSQLGPGTAIAHAHVLFVLQHLMLQCGSETQRVAHHGELAFLMLALNDHLPQWVEESPNLSTTEEALGSMLFATVFNETSDDPIRFVLRITEILSGEIQDGPIAASEWEEIQREAFGCSFKEYVQRFVVPVFMFSRTWGSVEPPALRPSAWAKGPTGDHYRRWFAEASTPLGAPAADPSAAEGIPSLRLPGSFFRYPFVQVDDTAVCVSPWHVRDHASLGTWSKLNNASKKVLNTDSNQRFTSTFGYLFERWCAALAMEASAHRSFKGKVLLPSSPGAEDEIEDVVVVDRDRVALFSAKSSLVPEMKLKSAPNVAVMVDWLRRFFFEDQASAKASGYRAGALYLLDRKVQRIRAGEYEDRGIRKGVMIIPVVVSFDNVGESGILYRWIEQECARLGILSARPQVRPLTILTPDDYEALLALATRRRRLCGLLVDKTRRAERWGRTDWFISRQETDGRKLRLPGMEQRFDALFEQSRKFMRDAGLFEDEEAQPQQ